MHDALMDRAKYRVAGAVRGSNDIRYMKELGVLPGSENRVVMSRLYNKHVGSYDSGRVLEKKALSDPRIRLLTIIGGVKIYHVSGEEVRKRFYADFTAGGNHEVYPWIPADEVWTEHGSDELRKMQLTVLHELVERAWMKAGRKYPTAHDYALTVEHHCRVNPELLPLMTIAAAHGVLLSYPEEKKVIAKQRATVNDEG